MHARVSYIDGEPDKVGAAIEQAESQTIPALREEEGFKGFTALVDRSSGRLIGITFWESEDALNASQRVADEQRADAAQKAGSAEPRVEVYEVALDHME